MEGIREVDLTEIKEKHHADWDSLDEYVEYAAMTMQPNAEFESQGQTYVLLVDGTTILSRYDEPNPEDRYKLSSCAVVVYCGDQQKPIYFTNCNEGVDAWNKLCVDMGHPEAQYDEPPIRENAYLN